MKLRSNRIWASIRELDEVLKKGVMRVQQAGPTQESSNNRGSTLDVKKTKDSLRSPEPALGFAATEIAGAICFRRRKSRSPHGLEPPASPLT